MEKILKLAQDSAFSLPIDRGNYDFYNHLKAFLKEYNKTYFDCQNEDINKICENIIQSVAEYLNGKPAKAYKIFFETFEFLHKNHFIMWYEKDMISDSLPLLFRVRKNDNYSMFSRSDMFHVPFNKRHLCNTSRYSIAGYPSLYLSTSLKLCCNELRLRKETFLSGTVFKQTKSINGIKIYVLELSIKPSDFLLANNFSGVFDRYYHHRHWNPQLINSEFYQESYFYWYPVIAACSYIRNDANTFAPEYIIPQLLMQCIREKQDENTIYGIRYFPCSSKESSDLGINYVFPTCSFPTTDNFQYCKLLSEVLHLKVPVIFNSNDDIEFIEKKLIDNGEFGKI